VKEHRRSQGARDRILAAARQIFGDVGFQRATIRAIARAANIHPSMVMRYYESKEKLFAASAIFDLKLPALSEQPFDQIGRLLVEHFLIRWEMNDQELPALLRLAVTHELARERLLHILTEQLQPTIAKLCGRKQAPINTALVVTQMIGLAFTRYVLCLPPVTALPAEVIINRVGETLQTYLTAGANKTDPPRKSRAPDPVRRSARRPRSST
jgi:AcrR family transcriptional regulator